MNENERTVEATLEDQVQLSPEEQKLVDQIDRQAGVDQAVRSNVKKWRLPLNIVYIVY